MAQDKSAEIISFSGATEPPQSPAPTSENANADQAQPPEQPASPKPGLEELGAGAFLRTAREAANLSVETVSAATKVKAEHVEAIEWMRLDRLPALAYVTGFVKAYARYLGLDAERVAAAFKAEAIAATPAPVAAPAAEGATFQGEGARLGSVFAMLAVILFALWIGYQVLGGGGHQEQSAATGPTPRAEARQALTSQASQIAPASNAEVTPQNVEAGIVVEETASTASADVAIETPAPVETSADAPETAVLDAQISPSAEEEAAASNTPEATDEPASAEVGAPAVEEPRERALPRRARPAPPARQPVIVKAELSRSIAPDYPNRCTRGANDMESVSLRFDVSTEGRAVNMRVTSSTNSCFETEALNTVGRWRFSPRTVDGALAVERSKTATLNFRK